MACSRRSNRSSDGGERAKSYAGETTEKKKRGESKGVFCLVNFSPALHYLNAWNRLGEGGSIGRLGYSFFVYQTNFCVKSGVEYINDDDVIVFCL